MCETIYRVDILIAKGKCLMPFFRKLFVFHNLLFLTDFKNVFVSDSWQNTNFLESCN